jgi:4-hydroxy-3-methylbut-2-enyl diphosphate reductase IspH
VEIGLTAGASTPNNKIGDTVARILATRDLSIEDLCASEPEPGASV